MASLIQVIGFFLMVGFWAGSFLFGFLLMRWLVHPRAETVTRQENTAGTVSMMALTLLAGAAYLWTSGDTLVLAVQIMFAPPFGALFFVAGQWLVGLPRRMLLLDQPIPPEVLARRRRLSALGMLLTTLAVFGAERLLV